MFSKESSLSDRTSQDQAHKLLTKKLISGAMKNNYMVMK